MQRCAWAGPEEIYITYHDTEWGVPQYDSRALWEQLILEGFQAGLSWITVLKKRDNFRAAFAQFDPNVIATWGAADVDRLLQNSGIIRHRGKIEATLTNAQAWQRIEADQGFATYIWSFVGNHPQINSPASTQDIPAVSDAAKELSQDLKKKGFKFCGPTIVYAFMQAAGLVNDHVVDCPCHPKNVMR